MRENVAQSDHTVNPTKNRTAEVIPISRKLKTAFKVSWDIWGDNPWTTTQRAVAEAICKRVDSRGQAWPSLRTICVDTGLGKSAVCEALKVLEKPGGPVRITRERQFAEGHFVSTLYTVRREQCEARKQCKDIPASVRNQNGSEGGCPPAGHKQFSIRELLSDLRSAKRIEDQSAPAARRGSASPHHAPCFKKEIKVPHLRLVSSEVECSLVGKNPRTPHPILCGIRHPLVPQRVSVTTLCPRVPDPPLLDPKDAWERHANLLALWYDGARKAVYGKESWTFRFGGSKSKWKNLLRASAKLFVEHSIRPAAWCRWSFEFYRVHIKPGAKTPPAPSWVFSPKRLENPNTRKMFFEGAMSGGKVVYTPTAKKLLRLQANLSRTIAQVYPRNDHDLLAVVQKVGLTPKYHGELCAALREEAAITEADLKVRARNGSWIW